MATTQHLPDGSELLLRVVYSNREKQGVNILVAVACLSLVAIVALLFIIAFSAFNTRRSLDQHLFVRTHVAAYFISLLLCDLLQAIGSIANASWVNRMAVEVGGICVMQGVLRQASDVGTAFWTLVIAIHTFCLLFLELKLRTFVLWTTLFGGWSAIVALVLLGPATLDTERRGPFYGISDYWCWISPHYKAERVTLDYMIIFLSVFISFVLYALVFLRLRGKLVGGTAARRGRKFAEDQAVAIARQMLLYPVAYIVLVLPIASSQFASWAGHKVSFEATIFTEAFFLLSGIVNVALFSTTRRILPAQSMKIGKWSISRPRELPPVVEDECADPYYQTPQPQVEKHFSRIPSQGSSGAASGPRGLEQKRKEKARPPDIIVRRDSIESMYSVYDDEEVHGVQRSAMQPRLSTQWSPDGSPQRRSWRY